ncbi:MAG: ABC transporter permease [Candidatus Auribacterota bacterium]|jgi:molybdate/tungstate transport system permease protein|nr:ABC transporter permease [Candidatus Auribacterota bacterium]
MSGSDRPVKQWLPPVCIMAMQTASYIIFGISGWFMPLELFSVLLFLANVVICRILIKGGADNVLGSSIMFIIMTHALIGQRIAPDSLTSGSILMVNILILYVGFKIYENLSKLHFMLFVVSYGILFAVFIIGMENAEALFLLALMGLAATARDFRLLSYYWALVVAFTFCQPYAWPAVICLFFLIKILQTASDNRASATLLVFLASGLLLVFFVLLPVLILLADENSRNIVNMLKNADVLNALFTTAITATCSTLILTVLCVPLAYALVRSDFFGKTFLLSIIDLPIIIPQSAAGIMLLRVFSKQQVLGEFFFHALGIRFDGTLLGVILAQIFVSMPFILKSAMTAFSAVPLSLEQNARTLGASALSTFRRVVLPVSARGLLTGCILAWARAAGEFGAVLFIAPYPQTAPVAVYNRFTSVGLLETAPLVATLILFSVLLFFLMQFSINLMPKVHTRERN